MGGEQSIPVKASEKSQMFRLTPRSCASFDCPGGETHFELADGSTAVHPFAIPGLAHLNAVQRPNNGLQWFPVIIGVIGSILGLFRLLDWYYGFLFAALAVVGPNVIQQWQVNDFIDRLNRACDMVGCWRIHTQWRCDNSCACYNGYRQFWGRKQIFAEYLGGLSSYAVVDGARRVLNELSFSTNPAIVGAPFSARENGNYDYDSDEERPKSPKSQSRTSSRGSRRSSPRSREDRSLNPADIILSVMTAVVPAGCVCVDK